MKLILLPFLIATLSAQNVPPPKYLRIIPLGEEAPLKPAGLKNKVRVFKEAAPGEFIPKDLEIKAGNTTLPLPLSLRTPSQILKLDGNAQNFLFETNGRQWLKRKAPAIPLTLGVLYPDSKTMSWNDPKLLLLKDDAAAFPVGTVRFVNTSDVMVHIQIGGEKAQTSILKPGTAFFKKLGSGTHHFWIGYPTRAEPRNMVFENKLNLTRDQRLQFFFYKPKKKNSRNPFDLHYFPEEIPKPE